MPVTSIEVLQGRSPEEKSALIAAVHASLVEALRIPDHDRKYRLREYSRAEFVLPPSKSERYTLLEISLFPGRSLDAKRRLYQALQRRLGALGTAPDDIFVVLHEPPMENFGVGGKPASEIDLGFEVNV